jgi:hypothetical protein
MNEDLKCLKRRDDLIARHRELDEQINGLSDSPLNQLLVLRLKKEKLRLRDEIAKLEQVIYPDIIA